MLRKLAIPALFLGFTVAAATMYSAGCDDDNGGDRVGSGGATGSGGASAGSGGASAGTGGGGGAAAGTGGGGGASAGTGGGGGAAAGTGGASAGTGGGGGSAAGSGGAGGALSAAAMAAKAMCGTAVTAAMGTFSASDFCALYLATCSPPATGLADMATCMSTFTQLAATPAQCRSYHVCNAATMPNNVPLHCGHAAGMTPCM